MNFDNTNKGALFQSKDKKTDKHPDYNGTINVNGDEYWLSGWKKQSKDGKPYLSLSVQEKVNDNGEATRRPGQSKLDDIPF